MQHSHNQQALGFDRYATQGHALFSRCGNPCFLRIRTNTPGAAIPLFTPASIAFRNATNFFPSSWPLMSRPHWIDELHSRKMLLIVRHKSAIVRLSDRSQNHIERGARPSGASPI